MLFLYVIFVIFACPIFCDIYPEDMPVIVSGYENGYENFYQPYVKKVKHLPDNPYYDGQFQLDENGAEALLFQREERYD